MDKFDPSRQISNTFLPKRGIKGGEGMSQPSRTDLRVIKTKRAIRQAFAELVSRMPLEDITVSDIAQQALINRKTFYAHYAGVRQLPTTEVAGL